MWFFKKPIFLVNTTLISILLSISQAGFAQSSSNYLDALEGEAENLSLDRKTQSKRSSRINSSSSSTPIPNSISNADGIQPNLSFDDFMLDLKANYFGTHIFIQRLSNPQKQEVYSFYLNNNNPRAIRKEVIRISKKN